MSNLLATWDNLRVCVNHGYISASTAIEWRDQLRAAELHEIAMEMAERDNRTVPV